MKIVEFSSEELLDDFIDSNAKKFLGYGKEGYCILASDGSVIKKIDYGGYREEWLRKFEEVQIPQIYFANGGALVNSFAKALFMDFAPCNEIIKINFERYLLKTLYSALGKLKASILALSELGIKITDIFHRNILFDGKSFSLVDTQEWKYDKDANLANNNLTGIMREIYFYMFTRNRCLSEFIKNTTGRLYLSENELLTNPSLLLEIIEESFREEYREDMETLGDVKRVLKGKIKC